MPNCVRAETLHWRGEILKYRSEIDGLRALAVLPVIFFHAGLDVFSGGFVGVDVFFVISGYLISSIIIAERQAGSFSLKRFYERRARRIMPALMVVVIACLPFAWLWLFPADMKGFSKSVRAVFTFSSNVLFKNQVGYFESASELKPLLHTWSLAVEEQFYLVFPLLLCFLWRFGRLWVLVSVALCALISFSYSEWAVGNQPSVAYFMLWSRAWELMVGSILSLVSRDWVSNISRWMPVNLAWLLGEVSALAGLGLILGSIFFIDREMAFPGMVALYPTFGAALVIAFASPNNIVGSVLGSRWPVRIGLISYSAYLWHQPIFAFARHRFGDELSGFLVASLVGVTIFLAYLTWRFVEAPARDSNILSGRRFVVWCSFGCVLLIGIGVVGEQNDGFEGRLTENQREIFEYARYDVKPIYREGSCFLKSEQSYKDFTDDCRGDESAKGSAMIWGDSHAAALSFGVRSMLPNLVQYTASGCPPFIGYSSNWRSRCGEILLFVQKEVARIQPETLYLHANWLLYKNVDVLKRLSLTLTFVKSVSPFTRVVILGGVPQFHPSLPVMMLRRGLVLDAEHRMPVAMYSALSEMDHSLSSLAQGEKIRFVSALDRLCIKQDCLATTENTGGFVPIAWDYGHLTKEGSLLLAAHLVDR